MSVGLITGPGAGRNDGGAADRTRAGSASRRTLAAAVKMLSQRGRELGRLFFRREMRAVGNGQHLEVFGQRLYGALHRFAQPQGARDGENRPLQF